MALLDKIKSAWTKASGVLRGVFNRYESAVHRWGERSWISQSLQSARFDVDAFTRQELQRKHRYWVANSPLVQRIRSLFIQFSVGVSGLKVVPDSDEDEDWNAARQMSWQRWAQQPEVNTALPLSQACIQWAGAMFDDGEVFIHKSQRGGVPAIETFEAHRVQTPMDLRNQKDVIDGIRYEITGDGGVGRPLSYFVLIEANNPSPIPASGRDPAASQFLELPARDIIHCFKARRPGQLRGIPEGFSGMNTLHDYEDLHMLEMQVAKMAASLGTVETNTTGELDALGTRKLAMSIQSQNKAGQVVTKQSDQFYYVTMGAQKIAIKHGDSLKQFQVDRPSIVTQQYWDLLVSEICCAYNVPKLLVVPYSLQGTVTRADLDVCANAFRFNFEIIAWALQQVYEWQTAWAVKYDRSMDGRPPQDFIKCVIQPPRAPNVDIGYTAQALALELKMGTKTYQDVFAERQQDWRHQARAAAEFAYYIKKVAKEFSKDGIEVTPQEIADKLDQGAAQPPEPDSDENQLTATKEAA